MISSYVESNKENYSIYKFHEVPSDALTDSMTNWPNDPPPRDLSTFDFGARITGKENHDWIIRRHQIDQTEPLYSKLEKGEKLSALSGVEASILSKDSSEGSGKMFEVILKPTATGDAYLLVQAVLKLSAAGNQNTV